MTTAATTTGSALFGTQRINEKGHLEIGGCDAVELAREFGTPLYVLDEAYVRANMREYLRAFGSRYPKVSVAFAGKAMLTTAIARIVEQEGLRLDVASAGELYTALKASFPTERIVMHGNNKSRAELDMALSQRIGLIVIDNLFELEMLSEMARQMGAAPRVMVRATPAIDPHTHRRIRTGQADSKFGMNIKDGTALEAARRCADDSNLQLAGVHCHVGSQLMDAQTHLDAADIMCAFLREVADATGSVPEELNIGGGLGIRYTSENNPYTIDRFAEELLGAVRSGLEAHGLGEPVLGLEPGRSIVGQAGVTLYEVGAIKRVSIPEEPGYRLYVNIDGGMSDNPRPQLYDAVYEPLIVNKASQQADTRVRISGKHCETDILISDTLLQEPAPGDILGVQATGAYNYAMASNYNRLTKPAVVLVHEGSADLIVRRQTLEDVVAQDVIPPHLA